MRIRKIGNSLLVTLLLIVAFHVVTGTLPQPEGKKRRIELLNADLYTYDRKIVANAERAIGNVAFSHNNVLLYCDSAYNYKDSNKVDAFGRVHIIKGDSLNLWGDRIIYDGNSKIAIMKGNVKLVNKSIVLTTDELTFDLRSNIGNYQNWGKIVDTANVLVSKIGRYYSNEDLFFFKDSVKLTNKDFILTADTLKYNSKTERVFIVGPTHIVGTTKQGTLYSEKGWYDTRTNLAELYKASKLIGKEQSLQGDTMYYSRNAGTGRAISRVVLSDTTNHVAITGRRGTYNEKTKIAFVTDSAIFMQFSPTDTLFLHADTLKSVPEISKKQLVKKLVGEQLVAKKSTGSKTAIKALPKDTSKVLTNLLVNAIDTILAKKDTLKSAVMSEVSKLPLLRDSMVALADTGKISKLLATLPVKLKQMVSPDSLSALADTGKVSKLLAILPDKLKQMVSPDSLSAIADTGKVSKLLAVLPVKLKQMVSPDSLSALLNTGKVSKKLTSMINAKSPGKDSLTSISDTLKNNEDKDTKIFMAYHRVRFFKKDLQGICDSLSYQMKDSVMRLFVDPILWADVHQLSADKIEYRPHKPGTDIARLDNNGFIISKEDSVKFNQISGKVLIGYIIKKELKIIEVNGNAIALYYLKNKDRYSGMNKMESSKINVYMLKSKIDSISFFPKPEGKLTPLKDLISEDTKLKGFTWRESEKPKNRFDLFPLDEKRKKIAGPEKKPALKSKQNTIP
jgi:lipopolysaccharide export system protein LptA